MAPDVVDLVGVETALRSLAPAGVGTGARLIDARDIDRLHPVEAAAVERAVDRRRREFASGRTLLRQLLGAQVAIPVRPDRSPELPDGATGSLAHDADLAVAAVSFDRAIAALGIDVQPAVPLSVEMAAAILRPDEVGLDADLSFTLKEAVYKAWSATGGELIDFHAVRLTLDGDRFSGEVVAVGTRFEGRYTGVAGRWLALVVVERAVV